MLICLRRASAGVMFYVGCLAGYLAAQEKLVVLDDMPETLHTFELSANGGRLFFGSGSFYVFDNAGKLIDKYGCPSAGKELAPLSDGSFLACIAHGRGMIARYRADGNLEGPVVERGRTPEQLRSDATNWSTPTGFAIDEQHNRMFVLDVTAAPRDERKLPDPDWSRIAVFDLKGKFINEIHPFDALSADAQTTDDRRMWYEDIEVDPARERVYVTSRRTRELLAFGYDGREIGRVVSPGNMLAVFPNGDIAVGGGGRIELFSPSLASIGLLEAKKGISALPPLADLEVDAAGRLHAATTDRRVTFVRWSADRTSYELFGPRYRSIRVNFEAKPPVAGGTLTAKVELEGRPTPTQLDDWHVLCRPSDGSSLEWRPLTTTYKDGVLQINLPPDAVGPYEVAVHFGEGPISIGERARDLTVQTTLLIAPAEVDRSLAIFTPTGRHAFLQGEPIAATIVRRRPNQNSAAPASQTLVRIALERTDVVLQTGELSVENSAVIEIPAELTRHLAPGRYVLRPIAADHHAYPLTFEIVSPEPDSPLQRIAYHEFNLEPATMRQSGLTDSSERMAFIRHHAEAMRRLGFTRETDRLVQAINPERGPVAWHRSENQESTNPALPPARYYALPTPGSNWEAEHYLDQAVRNGLHCDTQLLGHCHNLQFTDYHLNRLCPLLAQTAQWMGRYPSFYGFNYNDELFFNGTPEDLKALAELQEKQFAGRPKADALRFAMSVMYDAFNAAVREANPRARTTTTPMWQYPAVEGSYAPDIYRGMSESYSHFLSESFHPPLYPAHSIEFLRRPGLPLMGVFEDGYQLNGGERYVKNLMQVLARGVQGSGMQHVRPHLDPVGASAIRTANQVARMYGPIFAECQPMNEGAILYSYAQDATEKRNLMGTPHWERVFELHSAGLMGGVPMQITYEEDVAAGTLLHQGRPVVPMLFLVGQTQPLPENVTQAIEAFQAAGGRVLGDADTTLPYDKLDLNTHQLKRMWHESYAADTKYPLFQPILEKQAARLRQLVEPYLRYPLATRDAWITKTSFDGGDIRYVMVTNETSPMPWDNGVFWSLGSRYCHSRRPFLPKRDVLTLPESNGVLYDVFAGEPVVTPEKTQLPIDLRTFPAQLFAVAPARLGPPRLKAQLSNSTLSYRVEIADEKNNLLAAGVPLQIRLWAENLMVSECYRLSALNGVLEGQLVLPAAKGTCRLEVTSLLNRQASRLEVTANVSLPQLFTELPAATVERDEQIRALLEKSKSQGISLVTAGAHASMTQEIDALVKAFDSLGIRATLETAMPERATPGVYVAIGDTQSLQSQKDLLWHAWRKGLLGQDIDAHVPGNGRGLVTAVMAPRHRHEHMIALLGGDAAGVHTALRAFTAWLSAAPGKPVAMTPQPTDYSLVGAPLESPPLWSLSKSVGVPLSGIQIAADGKHLLVAADGFWNNLGVLDVSATTPKVLRAERVGESPTLGNCFINADGTTFGAANRTVHPVGEALHVIDSKSGTRQSFAAFGDAGSARHQFAVSEDGSIVIAPGAYGVVCWKRNANHSAWNEAWAIDHWKEFSRLDWPIAETAERRPSFEAWIPRGADYALILYGEFTNNAWISAHHHCTARLTAVNLSDGRERWRFDVPIPKTVLFPKLHTSADGKHLLLQVQTGSWNTFAFRFFALRDGKSMGTWHTQNKNQAPLVAISDATGRMAIVNDGRLLEVREPDGRLLYNETWPDQPVSVSFMEDDRLGIADDAERISLIQIDGTRDWSRETGTISRLAGNKNRLYAAGWDGRLRAFDLTGKPLWTFDCTPAMNPADPAGLLVDKQRLAMAHLTVNRPSTTTQQVPAGENLLQTGKAKLTLGGISGWMSNGTVQVTPAELTNGKLDDLTRPWLSLDELFWDAATGRQVWAEINFSEPTDVQAITVHEDSNHPESWPNEGLVQVWDEKEAAWKTAAFGVFLKGPVNTYQLDLKAVRKLRYLPWSDYHRNFWTSEIEIR